MKLGGRNVIHKIFIILTCGGASAIGEADARRPSGSLWRSVRLPTVMGSTSAPSMGMCPMGGSILFVDEAKVDVDCSAGELLMQPGALSLGYPVDGDALNQNRFPPLSEKYRLFHAPCFPTNVSEGAFLCAQIDDRYG